MTGMVLSLAPGPCRGLGPSFTCLWTEPIFPLLSPQLKADVVPKTAGKTGTGAF